jgi:hypothetical protein
MKFQFSPFYTALNSDDSSARVQAWLEIDGPLVELQAKLEETFEASPCDMYIVSVAKTALLACQHENNSAHTFPVLLLSSFYKLSAVIRAVQGGLPQDTLLQRISHGFENGVVSEPPTMHRQGEGPCCEWGSKSGSADAYYRWSQFTLVGKSCQCLVVLLSCLSHRSGYILPMHHYRDDHMQLRLGGADRTLSVNFWLNVTVSTGRRNDKGFVNARGIIIKKLHALDNSAVVFRGRLCR